MKSNMKKYNDVKDDSLENELPDNERHVFSPEYESRKERIISGIKDAEEAGAQTDRKTNRQYVRYARAAAALMCAVILLPVTIHAAVTVYRFTVNQDGHMATGTIQVNEDGAEPVAGTEEPGTEEPGTEEPDSESTSGDAYLAKGSDGYDYLVERGKRYVEIKLGYLPEGMERIEENKYDSADGEMDMGLSLMATEWDGKSYDVVNRDVEKSKTLSAGAYEYLLFERGGVDYSFDRLAYIPVKDHSLIVTMYVGRSITDEELNNVIAGMSINEDIGDDPSKWALVGDDILDDSGIGDVADNEGKETADKLAAQNEEFVRAGYKMRVNDIKVYDNLCGISENDIMYWLGGIDSRFVDEDGKFKTVKCRRLKETTGDSFSKWEDYNNSSLRLIAVDMTYEYALSEEKAEPSDVMDFYLDRGILNDSGEKQNTDTTNYYYAGGDASAQSSQKMTFVSPAYAEIDGRKAELNDVEISMNSDGESHSLKVYFIVDESELSEAFMTVSCIDGYSQMYNSISVYLGEGTE